MSDVIFNDKMRQPNNRKLATTLGPAFKYWIQIKNQLETAHGELVEEWKFYNEKSGWTLKLLHQKRNLFFFTPCDKHFRLSFVFGDRAVSAVEKSGLPQQWISELTNARKYAEGRGLRIKIKSRKDIDHIIELVRIKIEN